ncbi:MAG: sigma-70 family RNA polymerase sigma factor [Nitrospirota bacterium]
MNHSKKKQSSETVEDKDLIASSLQGDRSSFNTLITKYKCMVFNLCFRFLGNPEDANEMAQETFVKVFCNLSQFKLDSSFKTWLYRITVNTCLNKIDTVSHRLEKLSHSIDSVSSDESPRRPGTLASHTHTPEKVLEIEEKRTLIFSALKELSRDHRTIIILRDIEGLSYEEICSITSLEIGTIKSRLFRARQTIRDKLQGVI